MALLKNVANFNRQNIEQLTSEDIVYSSQKTRRKVQGRVRSTTLAHSAESVLSLQYAGGFVVII